MVDSLYFGVVTLTTIGYGGFSPSTTSGKIFTIFYIVFGIILGFVNTLTQRSTEQRGRIRRFLERRAKGADLDGEKG